MTDRHLTADEEAESIGEVIRQMYQGGSPAAEFVIPRLLLMMVWQTNRLRRDVERLVTDQSAR